MLPRNAFNVANWSLRQTPYALILRPTWKTALFRLLFGTGFFALITFGLLGIDYELRNMRDKRIFSPDDIARFDQQMQPQIDRLYAANQPDQARALQLSSDQMKNSIIQKRAEDVAKIDATQRPWRILLYTLAGICVFSGLYLPLSTLWLRLRITRSADTLTFRLNSLIPRTRSIATTSINSPRIERITQKFANPGHRPHVSYYWKLTLTDPHHSIQLFLFTSPDRETTIPPHLDKFLNTLYRFASQSN